MIGRRQGVPIIGADFCHEMLVRAEAKSRPAKNAGSGFAFWKPTLSCRFPAIRFRSRPWRSACGMSPIPTRASAKWCASRSRAARWPSSNFPSRAVGVMGPMYRFYFRHILPQLQEQMISPRSKDNAYRYLPESVTVQFPDGEAAGRPSRLRPHGLIGRDVASVHVRALRRCMWERNPGEREA